MIDPQKDIQEQVIAKAREDEAFRQQILSNPKATLEQELGYSLPENVEIEIVQQTPHKLYLVFPLQPEFLEEEELSEKELEAVAGGLTPGVVIGLTVTIATDKLCSRTWPCK